MSRPISDMAAFKKDLQRAKHIVALTGAGISAESGIPTFRGAGGFWRKYEATSLATPSAFSRDPSLVWEFYHYRRELVLSKEPNNAHHALAQFEQRCVGSGKQFVVITQNVDDLHARAGTKNLLQLHGSLYRVRCTKCGEESENRRSPICESLRGKGAPDPETLSASIPVEQLPRCKCGGLLRPAIVWFGESLDAAVLTSAFRHLEECDVLLVIGTSAVVQPAASFAPMVAQRGGVVAEFNTERTPITHRLWYHFCGAAGVLLPQALED